MSYNIDIFLNNKLISCDTIVPFIMSLQKIDGSIKANYYMIDYRGFSDIKNNQFLYYSLKKTGELILIGSTGNHSKLKKIYLKLKTLLFLLKLFLKLFLGKTKIFHFGALSYKPYNILTLFFSKIIFRFEASSWISHKNGKIFDNLLNQRNLVVQENYYVNKYKVYFNSSFIKEKGKKNSILMISPRTYRTWYEHVIQFGVPKCKSFLKDINYTYEKGYFVYIMGHIGHLEGMEDANKSLELLIPKTLKLLSTYSEGLPILVKPHSVTNMDILHKIIEKHNFNNVYITYLHTAVLSVNAKLVVSNYFSNTQADAYFFGATTVEFTHYSRLALKKLKGKSINPNYIDYFINNDENKFKSIIQKSLSSKNKNKVRNIYEDFEQSSKVRSFYKNYII